MRVGIVGGGIFGVSAALALARRRHVVTVFDREAIPAPDAASTDRSKALRFEYGGACPLYVPLVEEARQGWRALESGFGKPLYVETGVLSLAASFDETCHEWMSHNYLIEHGWPVETWTPGEARRRFPQFSYAGIEAVTWNPLGGYLRAAEAVRATAHAARESGATLVPGARVLGVEEDAVTASVVLAGDERHAFDLVLVTVGAWFGTLFPDLAGQVRSTRQFVTYYKPAPGLGEALAPPHFPLWMHDLRESGWYGMPLQDGFVKVARHEPGAAADPDGPRVVTDADREASRAFVAAHLPALDPSWLAEDKGCLYAMTWDGNFLLDRLPGRRRMFAAGGGSGHGFKFGPAVGRLAADLLEGAAPLPAFRFDAPRTGLVR